MAMQPKTYRLPAALITRLDQAAHDQRISPSELLRQLVEAALERRSILDEVRRMLAASQTSPATSTPPSPATPSTSPKTTPSRPRLPATSPSGLSLPTGSDDGPTQEEWDAMTPDEQFAWMIKDFALPPPTGDTGSDT